MKEKYLDHWIVILFCLMSNVAFGHHFEATYNGKTIYYNITSSTDKTVAVTYEGGSYSSYSNEYTGDVSIPKTVSYGGITYSVTSIGSSAFSGCTGLTSIEIPNSVTSIGSSAFYGCTGLKSIEIPNSVTSIGSSAFYDTPWYNNLSNGLIYFNKIAYTYKGTMPSGTRITLQDGTVSIANEAFRYNCSGLASIEIPNTVTSIGDYAFYMCTGLTSIEIPNSVTSIGSSAFYGCTGLTSIEIPVTSIGSSAFSNCSGLTTVTIPNSVTSIDNSAFSGCTSLTSVTIPNSVTSIGEYAFSGCFRIHTINCLNPIPPKCDLRTFRCSQDYVRDEYDVYSYANLHVPMGSKELYSAANDWRYFNKIKEDMEMNGNVFYTTLTVQNGTTGYTRQAMKSDEKYTLYIGSLGDNKVNAVTFNGKDVTDEVVNGYYTTPELKKESVLSISFEIPSDVNSLTLNDVKVTGYNGEINVRNIDEQSDVFVYSVDGKVIANQSSAFGSISLQVPPRQPYIVKVGNRTYKVAL